MRRIFLSITAILCIIATAYAGAEIMEFSGEPGRNKITLRWKTGQESNINLFMVDRSTNNEDFISVGEVVPKGSSSQYIYIDESLANVTSVYYYRLRIRNTDGSFQMSESISVIPQISSFAKTWGSIKALFQ